MARLKKPKIGKNVIETLTSGMYLDPMFIYREYIQNAADQIDIAVEEGILTGRQEGKIEITIDQKKKSIKVWDNATGIAGRDVGRFLGDVARSEKDAETQKGFRGIGRLGGLGYCDKLIFETTAADEPSVSKVTLDAKKLRMIIDDSSRQLDASEVISVISNIQTNFGPMEDHYFRVTLENVRNPELLVADDVVSYLSMVAPVAFDKNFTFASAISKFFHDSRKSIDVYNVFVNALPVFKAYHENLQNRREDSAEVIEIDTVTIENDEGEAIALLWYGITDKLNEAINRRDITRGIRIRKGNITIGDDRTLNRFFPEERFNAHFIGELHVYGNTFKPNARRDYFNDSVQLHSFQERLRTIFKELDRLARNSSDIRNRHQDILNYLNAVEDFNEKSSSFTSKDAYRNAEQQVSILRTKAKNAKNKLTKIQQDFAKTSGTRVVYEKIITDQAAESEINVGDEIRTPPESFEIDERMASFDLATRAIVQDVFAVLDSELRYVFGVERRDMLKLKILDRLAAARKK